jgi:3-oxoacyl-[acyl-carrier-protein] synthase II
MSGVVVTGWSTLAGPAVEVGHLYEEPLPAPAGHALADFDVRQRLGRKGTSSFDRATALAVVCCQEALQAAGLDLDAAHRVRVGVALGTSLGSFKSTSDYSRETLVQDKPYLVNPVLFPNTVMNCAAGQVAIRFGLRGVNATIAGGALAFLNALRYAGNALERGYADVMLAGAVEEYTPHRAWAAELTGATATVAAGEAAGVFVLSRPEPPAWVGNRATARVLAVATGYGPGGGEPAGEALAGCVRRVLIESGTDAAALSTVYTGEADEADRREFDPVVRVLRREPNRVLAKRLFGECDAASGAVALAAFLGDSTGRLGLITGRGPDGAVGAAIVEGSADAGTDRGQ